MAAEVKGCSGYARSNNDRLDRKSKIQCNGNNVSSRKTHVYSTVQYEFEHEHGYEHEYEYAFGMLVVKSL